MLGYRPDFYPNPDLQDFLYLFSFVFILFNFVLALVNTARQHESFEGAANYFSERQADLDRLALYLENYDVVGVNGTWGSGKSYLIGLLSQKNQYNIIVIDLLSCRLEDMQLYIVRQITRLLSKNRIFSESSPKLNKILKNDDLFYGLAALLYPNDQEYSDALKSLQGEVAKLDKPIVIVFEDLDRLNESDKIYRIFDIAEKLACKNIKIVYQYSQTRLSEIDRNFTSDFLEKYIPYTVNLSVISFSSILSVLMEKKSSELIARAVETGLLTSKDFDFFNQEVDLNGILPTYYSHDFAGRLTVNPPSIRKVQIFLNELIPAIERLSGELAQRKEAQLPVKKSHLLTSENQWKKKGLFDGIDVSVSSNPVRPIDKNNLEDYDSSDWKKIAIIFYYIKHFEHDIYVLLAENEPVEKSIKIKYKDEDYSLDDFLALTREVRHDDEKESDSASRTHDFGSIQNQKSKKTEFMIQPEEIERVYADEENSKRLILLLMLGFQFEAYVARDNETSIVQRKEHNEKIDRLLWKLLSSSTDLYTDYERIVNIFDAKFFAKENSLKEIPSVINEIAGAVHLSEVEYKEYESNPWLLIFKAFCATVPGRENEIWRNLIDSYFEVAAETGIDLKLLKVLQHCNINTRERLFYVIDKFDKLNVLENLSRYPVYAKFLYVYFGALVDFKLISNTEIKRTLLSLNPGISSWNEIVKESVFKLVEDELAEKKKKFATFASVAKNFDIVSDFVEQNKKIIDFGVNADAPADDFNRRVRIISENQEKLDELRNLFKNKDDKIGFGNFQKILDDEYKKETISLDDIETLLDEYQRSQVIKISPNAFKNF